MNIFAIFFAHIRIETKHQKKIIALSFFNDLPTYSIVCIFGAWLPV